MKAGINLLLWTGEAHESDIGTIEQIAKWGYDGVEFPMFALDKSPWPLLGKVCGDLGLGRTAVAVLPEGANLIGDDAAGRLAAVDFLKGCVDQCHAAGMDALVGPLYSPVGRRVSPMAGTMGR
jgi:D-psicose/D-tagatose/L-ribulose 3-epimerase